MGATQNSPLSRRKPDGATRSGQETPGAAGSCLELPMWRLREALSKGFGFGVYSRAGMLARACFGSIWCWVLTFLLVLVLPHYTFNSSAKWHVFWRR